MAVLAFLAAGIVGAALYLKNPPPPALPPALLNAFTPASPQPSEFGWTLTAAMSAHRVLVLEVETRRPKDALAVAQQLTEMYQDRFDEVLVYFFEPDSTPRLATLRVQWTRAHGYQTLFLGESP